MKSIKNKLNELITEIEELEERLKNEQTDKWPKEGDKYYYVNTNGSVRQKKWEDVEYDRRTLQHTPIFRTEKEAEKEALRMRARMKLRNAEGRREFVVGEYNWYCLLESGEFRCYYSFWNYHPDTIYFTTKENLKVAVDSLTNEEYETYFGVKK